MGYFRGSGPPNPLGAPPRPVGPPPQVTYNALAGRLAPPPARRGPPVKPSARLAALILQDQNPQTIRVDLGDGSLVFKIYSIYTPPVAYNVVYIFGQSHPHIPRYIGKADDCFDRCGEDHHKRARAMQAGADQIWVYERQPGDPSIEEIEAKLIAHWWDFIVNEVKP